MAFDKRFNPDELKRLLQSKYGPGVHVELFPKLHTEQTGQEEEETSGETADLTFDHKPSDIKTYLDRFVIQQVEAKKVLATAVCDHYHHIQNCIRPEDCQDYKKQNILIIGPTGVGKTYLIQNIARLIGVPFVKADATKYSETGYVGGDVEDLIRELVHQAGGDVRLAEYGIVYVDEIDKIATPVQGYGRDVSGHGVQRGLLKLMEETEVPLRSPTDIASQMQSFIEFQTKGKIEKKTINTKHILFIVSGAFTGLTEIVRKRIGSKQIGFMGEKASADENSYFLSRVKSIDFIEYGFEAEFTGRLPVVVHCKPLLEDDLFNILKYSEGSLLKQYKQDFLAYGVDVYFTDDAMQAIAREAAREMTGARGLMSVCENLLREFKYVLPDSPVKEFVVTEETVEDPAAALRRLLEDPRLHRPKILQFQLSRFEDDFESRYGVRICFTPEAAAVLDEKAAAAGTDLRSYCAELFADYEHGLNLLRKSSGQAEFIIDRDAVLDPARTLERWIRETYR